MVLIDIVTTFHKANTTNYYLCKFSEEWRKSDFDSIKIESCSIIFRILKDRYPQYQQGHNVHQKWSLHLWPSHIDSVKSGLVGYMKTFRLWQIPHIQIYHHDLHLEWDLQQHLQILKDLHPQYQGQSPSGRGSPLFAKPCTQHEKRASGLQSGTRPEPVVDIEEDYRFPVSVELWKFNFDGKYPNEKVLRRFIRHAAASLQGLQSSGIYLSPRWTIIKRQAILCLKKTNYGINSLTINFTGPQTQHFPDETFLDTPHTPTK